MGEKVGKVNKFVFKKKVGNGAEMMLNAHFWTI